MLLWYCVTTEVQPHTWYREGHKQYVQVVRMPTRARKSARGEPGTAATHVDALPARVSPVLWKH